MGSVAPENLSSVGTPPAVSTLSLLHSPPLPTSRSLALSSRARHVGIGLSNCAAPPRADIPNCQEKRVRSTSSRGGDGVGVALSVSVLMFAGQWPQAPSKRVSFFELDFYITCSPCRVLFLKKFSGRQKISFFFLLTNKFLFGILKRH